MNYTINLGEWGSVFAVPTAVVDKHLRLAGALHLKTLLCMLRFSGQPLTLDDLTAKIGGDPADIKDAITFWVESGLIDRSLIDRPPAENSSAVAPPISKSPPESIPEPEKPKQIVRQRPPKPDPREVNARISGSPEVAYLMQEAQMILGRPISGGETASLLALHDYDGLPVGVIIMVMNYAKARDKLGMRYIEKVGMDWAASGIDTMERAEERLQALELQYGCWKRLEDLLGLSHRKPSEKEREYAVRWLSEWGFSTDVILLAYNRCVDKLGELKLSYINGILQKWQTGGLTTPDAISNSEAKYVAKPSALPIQPGKKPSYDLDEFEQMMQDELMQDIASISSRKVEPT